MKRVLVTGGTGFLGSALVADLAAHGCDVHVFARSVPADSGGIAFAGAVTPVTWHAGSLEDGPSIERAAAAVSSRAEPAALVHNAAVISYASADTQRQRENNVDGTRRVLEAAGAAGMRPCVHVSSVVTLGVAVGDEVLDEDSPFRAPRQRVDYVETKRAAEQLALAHADALDLRVVNPAAVFGPVDRDANFVHFLRQIARGKTGPLAPPGSLSVVGVRDTAAGIRLALERGRSGRRYVLAESWMTARDLMVAAARALGVRPVRGAIPAFLWPGITLGARLADRLHPLELAPPQALTMLGSNIRCSGQRARTELAWEPAPFEDVLRETVEYLRLASGTL